MRERKTTAEYYHSLYTTRPTLEFKFGADTSWQEIFRATREALEAAGYNLPGQVNIVTVEEVPQEPDADLN